MYVYIVVDRLRPGCMLIVWHVYSAFERQLISVIMVNKIITFVKC